MPNTTAETKTAEERLAAVEQKVDDLAAFVGRLTAATFGDDFAKYDPLIEPLLEWETELMDAGTEDEFLFGRWVYQREEMSDDA